MCPYKSSNQKALLCFNFEKGIFWQFFIFKVLMAKSELRAPNYSSGYTPELLIRNITVWCKSRDFHKTKCTFLKELQNCIICMRSLFCSGPTYISLCFLPILLENWVIVFLSFVLYVCSMFWIDVISRLKNIWLIIQVFFFIFSHFKKTICKNSSHVN